MEGAHRDAHHDKYSKIVGGLIRKPFGHYVDQDVLAKHRGELQAMVDVAGAKVSETRCAALREMVYLGSRLDLPVASLLGHYTVVIECLVRWKAVESGSSGPLFCELELAVPGRVTPQRSVAGGLVKKSAAAGVTARDFMAVVEPTSRAIEEVFKKKGSSLTTAGEHFRMEIRFFSGSCGECGIQRVQGMILANLPSLTTHNPVDQPREVPEP